MPAAPSYDLPPSAIAQSPIEPRDAARLLVDHGGAVSHRHVRDLPSLLRPGDVVVVNDSRVLPARLHLRKETGGAVEVLLLEDRGGDVWTALVKPGRRVPPGTIVSNDELSIEVGDVLDGGKRRVRLSAVDGGDVAAALVRSGEVPLPPYITAPLEDPERYQTVYASSPGSVAAPTAGLHLTPSVLAAVRAMGVEVHTVELRVGLDTFRPVTAERIEDHEVHEEAYVVPPSTWEACARASRVVAIGTTTVRALESAAATGSLSGRTRLLITPGHEWRVVDALLTNFHLPCSTLLLLVESFVGRRWRELYEVALAEGYRFLSFGDAMFLERAS